MKTCWRTLVIALALLGSLTQISRATVTFTATPSAISNTYNGTITLQVTGLTNAETVVVQKFLDANTNGVVDAGDILWQQFQLTDGSASVFHDGGTAVTNFTVPGDTDGLADGSITAKLYPSLDFMQLFVGKYLFVLSSPSGGFTPMTNAFDVTNFPFGQSFTGTVVSNSTPVPNAIVILFRPSGNDPNPIGGTVANNSGIFSITAPPGAYALGAFKSNYVADLPVLPNVALGAGETLTTNVPVSAATRSISGRVVDADNAGLGLAGFLVAISNTNNVYALAFPDTNGNFTARVTPDQWEISSDERGLAYKSYLGLQNSIHVDTTTGDVSGVTMALPKATAIFYGTVKDSQDHPLAGARFYASDQSLYEYESDVQADANGNYVAGASAGLWEVDVENPQPAVLVNYVFSQGTQTTLAAGQAYRYDFTAFPADYHITGHVQDSSGNPIGGVGVYANTTDDEFFLSTDTDSNGDFSFNVVNADWMTGVNCNYGDDSLDAILGSGNFQCPNNQSITINNNDKTVDFTILPANGGQIFGYVTDGYGGAVAGVNVYADDGAGDNHFAMTDGGGYYTFGVSNGGWAVSLDCGQLNSLGYQCADTNYVSVFNDPVEADFNVPFITTPTYPFTTLHGFSTAATNADSVYTNSDGFYPNGGLVLSGDTLYGTASGGGTNGSGTVFAVNTNITGFAIVHTFTAVDPNTYTNNDGANPYAGLILSGNTLYGTASEGGTNGNGTVFAVNTNGTGFRVLHAFTALDAATETTNSDGAYPYAGLILSGKTLYGTATYGGTNGNGTVFAVGTNGTGFTVLHTFTAYDQTYYTNSDGVNPYGGLILSGNTLYGMATYGGSSDSGTIFKINTNGTGFTTLYSFDYDNDGGNPYAGPILSDNILYGTTSEGGRWDSGTVFAVSTNGMGFKVLHHFTGGDDGAYPYAGLILSSNTLYGTADSGGSWGNGTVLAVGTNGTGFTVLHSFTGGDDGAEPDGTLILSGNTLYGTTFGGGNEGNGTVFALSITALPPAPTISLPAHFSNGQFQMTVNGPAGRNYTVQMSTNLISTNWTSLLITNPVNGSFLFSDPNATNKQRFYRIWVGP